MNQNPARPFSTNGSKPPNLEPDDTPELGTGPTDEGLPEARIVAALQQVLNEMAAGTPVEVALAAHPAIRSSLEPLVRAAEALRREPLIPASPALAAQIDARLAVAEAARVQALRRSEFESARAAPLSAIATESTTPTEPAGLKVPAWPAVPARPIVPGSGDDSDLFDVIRSWWRAWTAPPRRVALGMALAMVLVSAVIVIAAARAVLERGKPAALLPPQIAVTVTPTAAHPAEFGSALSGTTTDTPARPDAQVGQEVRAAIATPRPEVSARAPTASPHRDATRPGMSVMPIATDVLPVEPGPRPTATPPVPPPPHPEPPDRTRTPSVPPAVPTRPLPPSPPTTSYPPAPPTAPTPVPPPAPPTPTASLVPPLPPLPPSPPETPTVTATGTMTPTATIEVPAATPTVPVRMTPTPSPTSTSMPTPMPTSTPTPWIGERCPLSPGYPVCPEG